MFKLFFFAVVQELFYCHGLRKLSISDNEITSIPPAIASLDHLEELDFSKNGERLWGVSRFGLAVRR